ncbi:MAG: response regulator transcription factor, partial [Microvirga sp.]
MSVRVLIVDDVADVRRLVRIALRYRGGFEVVGEAQAGLQAVELAIELRPDVVLLDLGLPDLAGRDVLTRLRETSPAAKVVVFTGMDREDRAWFEQHTAGFVLKGDDLDYLVDLLDDVG